MKKRWDVFICHAGEDKRNVVEPLATELADRGLRVWYDRWELTIGDSLRRKIDEGLASSRYGIVILSPYFFAKEWPQRELDGLIQRELDGRKVILPVWHGLTREGVALYSPTLADRVAGTTAYGIGPLADELLKAIVSNVGEGNTETNKRNEKTSPQAAVLHFTFERLEITTRLHRYSLHAALALNAPPDQGRVRLVLLWPTVVRITRTTNLREVDQTRMGNVNYREFWLDAEERVFPGQTVDLMGLNTQCQLEYEYDDNIWSEMDNHPKELHYSLYLEDHLPIQGDVPFSKLNVY